MDLSFLIERNRSLLYKQIDSAFLRIICRKYCNGASSHSPICVYWSSREYVHGQIVFNDCRSVSAANNKQTLGHDYALFKVCDIYSEIHEAKILPPEQLNTAYMDICCDGYLVNPFEVEVTKAAPSLVRRQEVFQHCELLDSCLPEVTVIHADFSSEVHQPVLQHAANEHYAEDFYLECQQSHDSQLEMCNAITLPNTIKADVSSLATSFDSILTTEHNHSYRNLLKQPLIGNSVCTHTYSYLIRVCKLSHSGVILSFVSDATTSESTQSKVFDPGIIV